MGSVGIASIEDIIDEARNGRMYILVDDEDRENEGDLIIPAQMATPHAINFMATYGRGLICLALQRERVEKLGLPMMSSHNRTRHETAFTISIEAREGVTTGISAADRARTISVAINGTRGAEDIVTPGHVFPLMARDGGVLVRAGHTEASVDVSRLAGLNPSAVICEIMRDDGTMARLEDLIEFAAAHDMKIGTIRDLIAYRRKLDRTMRKIGERPMTSEFGGDWRAIAFQNTSTGEETLALVKGDIDPAKPTLVRMHLLSIMHDVFAERSNRTNLVERSMRMIDEAGCGVLVMINRFVSDYVSRALVPQSDPIRNDIPRSPELRDYGGGAQILAELGVHDMILLTNTPQSLLKDTGCRSSSSGQLFELRGPPCACPSAAAKARSLASPT